MILAIIVISAVSQDHVKFAFGQANPIPTNNFNVTENETSNNATVQNMDWQNYENSSQGFSIDYPSGWTIKEEGDNVSSSFTFLGPFDP